MDDESLDMSARIAGRTGVRASDFLTLKRQRLNGADFSGRKVIGFSAEECCFERCGFRQMTIEDACFGAGLNMSLYEDCAFDRSKIRAPAAGRARFVRCSFRDVHLVEWFCLEAEFVECTFTGIAEKIVFDAEVIDDSGSLGRSRNEYSQNDFSGLELRDAAFRGGIDLSRQTLPSGDEYVLLPHAREALLRARSEVSVWPDDSRCSRAMSLLRVFMEDVDAGQEQLLLRPDDYTHDADPSAVEDLFAILKSA